MKCFWGSILFILSGTYAYTQNDLSANLSVPHQIENGQVFSEKLTINKPTNLSPYTVFTQKIPDGFFIETKTVPGAVISFQNHILRITWLRLTSEKSINIPIKISCIKGLTGTYSLSGKLTYLIDNKKGEYKLGKNYFSINSENNTVSKNLTEYGKSYDTLLNIKCMRRIKVQTDKSYLIELTVNKLPAFVNAILTDEISQNFNIRKIDTIGAEILPAKRVIQFHIKKNTGNKDVVFKYRLIPKNKNTKQKPIIFGKLSFIKYDQIITVPVENQR